ncbi:IgGFc-binding protein [Mizuhopecten yessoensis]|uniref:IgGFc-binding protein n=1 Tax=Mizuhopecten yessoensis TaxID=6573 RepID=A0A210QLY7_MIZYE|nr:IgGFc-binding protein [Mizuhopecten yessoensis]
MFNAEVEVLGSALSIKGIKVTSDQQLLVYGISYFVYGLGGFLSLPVYNQGYIYYVVTADIRGEFLVIGVYPNTCVNIMLRITKSHINYNNIRYANGSTITEILNEYHTMQIYSGGDFTGSEIRSSKPVSVFSGSRKYKSDFLVDQLPPIKSWGKKYITVPPHGFQYDCKVMSGFPNTVVNYTCAANTEEYIELREAGSFQTLDFNTSKCLLISNEPILITIIVSLMDGEPAMITMPPLKEVVGELMVYVSDMVTAAQLVLVTNANITVDPTGPPSSTHIDCPEHLKFCIMNMENLICNQTYSISSEKERFAISGYVHGTRYGVKNGTPRINAALGYPIVHHASQVSILLNFVNYQIFSPRRYIANRIY